MMKDILGEECFSQHGLIVMDLAWKTEPIQKKKELRKIRC